ncbi:MAG: TlpA family protein disulfide reductase [gamma proteobacterium symbiont of Bathyaustriella thionipta]|nr:TlpA family protein disulfide reductase [gamma proteobacterium symbiont of Bathyaustriella thionipta]MCU7950412.1 TlpA family protein disulfide reductase [gamma proteobacterium symbiont of Bathyaustriella thionipta]MCU7953347.1 TlpA family protein disulfide reductase [gamma proteobacterium symbiont of Bathyaustriella thionipta]MCU7956913.1 TlpA family protein disulfide reductase [gamma proteobacterium symbiont of Bathyaustriella thionipta]MCU7968141.1 TlpA family protein disulfide reductase 
MKKKDFAVIAFIVLLAALMSYLWLAPSGQPLAPQASFIDIQGNKFTLAQLKGKPVIVNFWATECPGCVNEIPLLVKMYKNYSSQNLVIIGVAMGYDPESQVREMVRQKNMNYPIVLDSQDDLVKAFNIKVTPTTIFIGKDGRMHKRKLGEVLHNELETTIQSLVL